MLVAGLFTNQIKMTDEIKRLKKELKEWKSQEVKERFERGQNRHRKSTGFGEHRQGNHEQFEADPSGCKNGQKQKHSRFGNR